MTAIWRRAIVCLLLAPGAAGADASLRHTTDLEDLAAAARDTEVESAQAGTGQVAEQGLCQDFKRLRSVRQEMDSWLHDRRTADLLTEAEEKLGEQAKENYDLHNDVVENLVEFLDTKARYELCTAKKKSLQLDLESDDWLDIADKKKAEATKHSMNVLQAQQFNSKYGHAMVKHWQTLYGSEMSMDIALKKEQKDDTEDSKAEAKKCNYLSSVFEAKWAAIAQDRSAANSTHVPLLESEVVLDDLVQAVVERELKMYRALQAQKVVQAALSAKLDECPEAKSLALETEDSFAEYTSIASTASTASASPEKTTWAPRLGQ